MKHRLLSLWMILAALVGSANWMQADETDEFIVQGIDYNSTLRPGIPKKAPVMREGTILEPGTELVYDGNFTFDMIENWSGEGSKSAALVIQWNTGKDQAALVFGYHWDGEATGFDMFKTVVENNPQLFGLCQATNVGCDISPISPGGYTLCGIGWDVDGTGNVSIKDSQSTYTSDNGFYLHPRGWDPVTQSGNADYDYDNWYAVDPTAFWQAGWYSRGYWSYWCKDSQTSQFGYSGWGIACRALVDGSWDGWNFQADWLSWDWKPFVAAPALTPADAKIAFTVDGLCYKLKDYNKKTVMLVAPNEGVTYTGAITVPEKFVDEDIEYTVVGIDAEAFAGAEITTVTLPSTVTKLGESAFAGSTVESVNITDAITSIGAACFAGCPNITQAYFPSKITSVPENAYMATGIETLEIPGHITSIGNGAFSYCEKLKTVSMGATLLNIGEEAFAGCTALENVTVKSANPPAANANSFDEGTAATLTVPEGFANLYATAAGWSNFTQHAFTTIDVNVGDRFVIDHIPYLVTAVGEEGNAVSLTHHYIMGVAAPKATQVRDANRSGYEGVDTIAVPAVITYQGKEFKVAAVCDSAFYEVTTIKSVSLPAGTSLENSSLLFYDCTALEDVTLPSDATTIGKQAFGYCKALKKIELPSTMTTLGEKLFYSCTALDSVGLPALITAVPDYCFNGCSALQTVVVPDSVTALGSSAFGDCAGLTSVTLPPSLTSIGSYCFMGCKSLEGIQIPATVESIGNYAFNGMTALKSIELPRTITTLGNSLFSGCSSLVYEIPDNITSIGEYCFKGCTAMTDIVIPNSVTSFGYYGVFEACMDLNIYSAIESPVAAKAYTFRLAYRPSAIYATITVLTGTKDSYSGLAGWKSATIVEPQLASVVFGQPEFNANYGHVELTVPFTTAYGAEYADAFVAANAKWLTSAIEATATSSDGTVINGTAKWADGKVTLVFEDVPQDTELTYAASGQRGEIAYAMEAVTFSNPAPALSVAVDFDKIDFWVGEGESQAALVLRWNDCVEGNSSYVCPLDNMVMGVRYAENVSVADIVAAAVQGNRRLGNPTEGQYTYDMTGRGLELTAYDHDKATNEEMAWNVWLGRDGKVKGNGTEQAVADGDIICLDYQAAGYGLPTALPELFYIPADDKTGVFFPENTHFTLRDNCHLFVPFYVSAGQDGTYSNVTVADDPEKQYAPFVTSAPMISNASQGNTTLRAHMNFITGKTGSFPVTLSANINDEIYTATTNVVIDAPANPISAITLMPADTIVITGYPNKNVATLEYEFEPADASFTKVNWVSTDPQVATVSGGKISAGGKQGACQVRLVSAADESVYAEVEVQQALNQLAEAIEFGPEDGTFNMQYMDILLIEPTILPENADNKNFTYEIIGDPEIATTYSTKDIINHKPGTVQVKISTVDGSDLTKTVTINFAEPNRTPLADNYQDGTFWLNEEWFTHTNGSINYITKDGELVYRVYESQNPYESFGATSCSAVIYGDRIYVSSKQNQDKGDPRIGGGRLVIFDAKTLKKQAAFINLDANGGDGRTVVGVNPSKVYVGTTGGIKVLAIDNEANTFTLADTFIEGTAGGSTYSGQIGDMICVDNKVYAVKQSVGVYVIDTENDEVIATIPETKAVALVESYDGGIWCASTANLYRIDPETNEFVETYAFPSTFPQSWSAWRPSNLFASKKENVLYWGHSNGWNAGCDWIYRWEIGTEFPTEPIFNTPFPSYPGGTKANGAYAGGGYDSRTNTLLVASCSGAGTSARYNHLNYIDGTTGELKKSVEMKPYFWFPSHPLFPDKYAPELSLEEIVFDIEDGEQEFDLNEYVKDLDNLDCNIRITLDCLESEVAQVELDSRTLTISPLTTGELELVFTLESNGKVSEYAVPVKIDKTDSGAKIKISDGRLWYAEGCLEISGYEGYVFTIGDLNGRCLKRFAVERDVTTVPMPLPAGVYVAQGKSADRCVSIKFIVK